MMTGYVKCEISDFVMLDMDAKTYVNTTNTKHADP